MTDAGLLAAEVDGGEGSHPKLRRVGAVELAKGVLSGSEVADSAALTLALAELWETAGFRSKRVVLGIGNQRVLVRNHTVPQIADAHLGRALRYQVRDLLPVPVNETILDFYPTAPVPGSKPPLMDGLLIAALKDRVIAKVEAIENAGLKSVGVDLSSFAMLRALNVGDMMQGKWSVISIGDRVTHIAVANNGRPEFVRIVPLGSAHVTDALVSTAKISHAEAIELKRRVGLHGGDDPEQQQLAEVVMNAADPIFDQIRTTQSYYRNNFTGDEVQGVIVLGTESRMPGFIEEISRCCGLTAVYGDTLAAVDTAGASPMELISAREPDLAVPIGLTLKGK